MVGDRDVPHIYFSLDVDIRYKALSACEAQSGAVSILVKRIADTYRLHQNVNNHFSLCVYTLHIHVIIMMN